jgi:hypothetical protein
MEFKTSNIMHAYKAMRLFEGNYLFLYLKKILKNIKKNLFFLKINIFLVFSDNFNALMLKIIF